MITKYWKRIVVIVVAIALFSAPLYWVTYWLYFNTRYIVYTVVVGYRAIVVKYDTWTDRVKKEHLH